QRLTGLNLEVQDQQIERLQKETNQWENQIQNLRSRREHLEQLSAQAATRKQEIEAQLKERQDQIQSSRDELGSLSEAQQALEQQIQEEAAGFHEVERAYNMAAQAYHNEHLQWTRTQSMLEGLGQELRLRVHQLETLDRQRIQNQESLKETRENLQLAESEAKEAEARYYDLLQK